MRWLLIISIAGLTSWMMSCSRSPDQDKATSEETHKVFGNLDTTVRAADDLYRFVNGAWLSRTQIPPDRGSWGAFDELRESNNRILREVMDQAALNKDYFEGTDERKASDFYASAMDSMLAEKSGLNPLRAVLDKIEGIRSKIDLQNYLVEEDLMNGSAFFSLTISPDKKNSARMMVYLGSGGIGLPERDYYFKADAKSEETRVTYRQHIANLLMLAGWDAARSRKSADRILVLESELAKAMLSKEDKRDPDRQYNLKSVADLSTIAPSVNWTGYLNAMGIKEDSIILTEPAYLKAFERISGSYPLEETKAYLRWSLLRTAAPYLDHSFVHESFLFNEKYMQGSVQMQPRWKRALQATDQYLGQIMGKLYVAKVFPPEAKQKAIEMVEQIRFAFADRIKALSWMSDSTKRKALSKLSAMGLKVGYPDKWKNYRGLVIGRAKGDSFYDNVVRAIRFQKQEQINSLGKPVDKSVWDTTPQTVNAFYNPQFNEIVFPAAILEPPFYDYRSDDAVNYGAIGAGIGHEISHGFDDEGSRYDASGNLRNWWKEGDLRSFTERSKALADQYSKYQALPGLFVQGQFTLGENIGDLGGLNAALDGLHRYFRENNLRPGLVDGLTADQRFFMSWATIWRVKYRDEALRTRVLTNEHAPGMFRANGPPSNMTPFYQAFDLKPGDKMYRDEKDRVSIW